MSWEGKILVTASNPAPGQLRPIEGDPEHSMPDNGLGMNVYVAGGTGISGSIPVTIMGASSGSSEFVNIVSPLLGGAVLITGTVNVASQAAGTSSVFVLGTASVSVSNLPPTQSVYVLNPSSASITASINSNVFVAVNDSTPARTGTVSSFTASLTAFKIISLNEEHKSYSVYNYTSSPFYIAPRSTVSTSSFSVKIAPEGYFETTEPNYIGDIWGVSEISSSGRIQVTEYTGPLNPTNSASFDVNVVGGHITASISGVVDITGTVGVTNWPTSQTVVISGSTNTVLYNTSGLPILVTDDGQRSLAVSDEAVFNVLERIFKELQKMNIHLSSMTGEEIDNKELE